MERTLAWNKIRDSIPDTFYEIVRAENLEREVRLSKPVLKGTTKFTPFTELETLAQELSELDKQLESERMLTEQKQEEFSVRWNLAYEMDQELSAILEKFSEFYDQVEIKLENDRKRTELYREETKSLKVQQQKLEMELEALGKLKEQMLNRRDLCASYRDYLKDSATAYNHFSNLVQGEEPYRDIEDLLHRFQTLNTIREDETTKTLVNLDKVAALKKGDEEERTEDENFGYTAHKRELEEYGQKLRAYVGKLNERVLEVKAGVSGGVLKVERPKMAIYALYTNLAKEMDQEIKLKESNVRGQLQFISKFLRELKKLRSRVGDDLEGQSHVAGLQQ